MLRLGKPIAEYEEAALRDLVYENHSLYKRCLDERFFILSGRKGCGKTTMVEHVRLRNHPDECVVVVNPMGKGAFRATILKLMNATSVEILPTVIEDLLRLSIHIAAFQIVEKRWPESTERIRSFLEHRYLRSKPAVAAAAEYAFSVSNAYGDIDDLSRILREENTPNYPEALTRLYRLLREKQTGLLAFIDDVDGVGYDNSPSDKILIQSIVTTAMKMNLEAVEDELPLHVVATIPSELLEALEVWNRDKVFSRTLFLVWTNPERLQTLIARRIGCELGLSQRKKVKGKTLPAADLKRTWDQFFPPQTFNRLGKKEPTLQYLVRHTFYTPRTMIDLCQTCLDQLANAGYTPSNVSGAWQGGVWDRIAQEACEDVSTTFANYAMSVFEKILPGIGDVVRFAFEGRPTIWVLSQFKSFLAHVAKSSGLSASELESALFSMGFFGYARRSRDPSIHLEYNLFFRYVRYTARVKADLAVVSPVFYDRALVIPLVGLTVIPHRNLSLREAELETVEAYLWESKS